MFEDDADPARRDAMTLEEQLAATQAPSTLVVRFGRTKMIGEYECNSSIRAGCGSKLVVRTHRGIELATLLTTTCPNSGCPTSVSRKEMLGYIDASGGKDYPFYDRGRVLRIAESEDMRTFDERAGDARRLASRCRELSKFYNLEMKVVDAEMTLEAERGIVFFHSESRVDFRELAQELGSEFRCRIDMRQVGSRDEARLVADYERCGQHCCCKSFLKVLKPVSMRSAKQQKATLDPLKISGRCGRLMCCLRYEDQTYKELKAKLPHRKTRVGTMQGPGIVVDGQILTQLVRVRLDDGRDIAVPLEELMDPDSCPAIGEVDVSAFPQPDEDDRIPPAKDKPGQRQGKGKRRRRRKGGKPGGPQHADRSPGESTGGSGGSGGKKRRRRRRKGSGDGGAPGTAQASADGGQGKKRRRRRRRRGGKGGGDGAASPSSPPAD
ncbi:MAG: regulatory iron-sulfur-containing complex subunit RicT [Phycisphaerales bacterium]|nr:regulatory iron-sulfur-containing complex subunit RicT [Phycisphaerales bacterium]